MGPYSTFVPFTHGNFVGIEENFKCRKYDSHKFSAQKCVEVRYI
jgi:hypothetical protein